MDSIYFVVSAIIGIIFFALLITIADRLRRLINVSFRNTKHPISNYYMEARLMEKTGDKKEALQNYYRCGIIMKDLKYKYITTGFGKISKGMIDEKIKELGGNSISDVV